MAQKVVAVVGNDKQGWMPNDDNVDAISFLSTEWLREDGRGVVGCREFLGDGSLMKTGGERVEWRWLMVVLGGSFKPRKERKNWRGSERKDGWAFW